MMDRRRIERQAKGLWKNSRRDGAVAGRYPRVAMRVNYGKMVRHAHIHRNTRCINGRELCALEVITGVICGRDLGYAW